MYVNQFSFVFIDRNVKMKIQDVFLSPGGMGALPTLLGTVARLRFSTPLPHSYIQYFLKTIPFIYFC
jgi:hypothetical protein